MRGVVTLPQRPLVTRARARPAVSWRVPCGTPMLLALMVWLCSLLLVAGLILPYFGGRVASLVSFSLLVFVVLACRAICAIRVDPGKE